MYTRQKLFMTVEGNEFDLDVKIGVFEGEVLSVRLFLICFNPLLNGLNEVRFARANGILRNGKNITNKAFADDANLISKNEKGLEKSLERFNEYLKWVVMEVKFNVANLPNSRREHSSFKSLGKEIFITQPDRGRGIQEAYRKNKEKQIKLKGFNGYSGLSKFDWRKRLSVSSISSLSI
jgi:hypothetical protein